MPIDERARFCFKKQQKHTALADIHESIDEMAHYRTHFLNLD